VTAASFASAGWCSHGFSAKSAPRFMAAERRAGVAGEA
jgi:hypothetical protein